MLERHDDCLRAVLRDQLVLDRRKVVLDRRRTDSKRLSDLGIGFKDLNTHQSSLEDIFVSLVSERTGDQP